MKYVVLEVADDWMVDELSSRLAQWHKVVGVFKVPTVYCDPTDGHRGKKTQAGWTRGKKYGWWVCGACKKPTQAWATNLNALLSSSRNLLALTPQVLGAATSVSSADASSPSQVSLHTTTNGTETVATGESANVTDR